MAEIQIRRRRARELRIGSSRCPPKRGKTAATGRFIPLLKFVLSIGGEANPFLSLSGKSAIPSGGNTP
jgi:hypothetical protein